MKPKSRIAICLISLILLLAAGGCQAAEKVGAETEIVVAEKSVVCEISNYSETPPLRMPFDEELGYVERGYVNKYSMDCSDPYLDGNYVGIQDEWKKETGAEWSSMSECVTTEGGVWKGTTHAKDGIVQIAYVGEGKYENLHMTMDFNLNNSTGTYKITKMVKE
jgi:hypothetical protein